MLRCASQIQSGTESGQSCGWHLLVAYAPALPSRIQSGIKKNSNWNKAFILSPRRWGS